MIASMKDEASKAFFEKRCGSWSPQDQTELDRRLTAEPEFARAYYHAQNTWSALSRYAETPEMVVLRQHALADLRQTSIRRWRLTSKGSGWKIAAAVAGMALGVGLVWSSLPFGLRPGQYQTRIGELRTLELEDRSRIAIDSSTRLRVRYTDDAREVQLLEGQAQFSVAQDPARPFKVRVGDRAIIALGTTFTVEYFDHEMRVAMLDGKVAVIPIVSDIDFQQSVSKGVELESGEALTVHRDGRAAVIPHADIEAATAWRDGKVILRTQTLQEAIRTMNRYSRVKIEIRDPLLAQEHISGVFEAGNSRGFVDDVKKVLPIAVQQIDSRTMVLSRFH